MQIEVGAGGFVMSICLKLLTAVNLRTRKQFQDDTAVG